MSEYAETGRSPDPEGRFTYAEGDGPFRLCGIRVPIAISEH